MNIVLVTTATLALSTFVPMESLDQCKEELKKLKIEAVESDAQSLTSTDAFGTAVDLQVTTKDFESVSYICAVAEVPNN